MTNEERQKHYAWLEKWKDADFVRNKISEANIDTTDIEALVHLFEAPLRVATMPSYPDPKSGLADMHLWLARLPRPKQKS